MVDVCHLNLAPHYRGGERQTELLVRELAARGLRQRLVVKRGSSLATRCEDVADLSVSEVASNLLAAGRAVRGSRMAHSHEGRTVYSALYANLFRDVPYVITRRVVAPQAGSFFRALAYRRAFAVAAVSNAAVEALQVRHPEISPVVIPDAVSGFAVDPDEVERIRATHAGKFLIGHIGALDQTHKGQSTIIEVARRVAESHPDWHFLLCGDGKDEARFRSEIGALRNIELVGWVDNVGDYLSAFDVFVYPSLHEALGSTILDAMQAGLPIVASKVGGIPSLVEDGVNGALVEPDDPAQLEMAIAQFVTDEEKRHAVGECNRLKSASFSASDMAGAYLRLYGFR